MRLGLTALLEWISSESLGTVAYWISIVNFTGSVETAGAWVAGIGWLPGMTQDLRITLVTRWTTATRLAILHLTIGILAARVFGADVHATTIQTIAELVWGTVLVVLANVLVVVDLRKNKLID